MDKKKRLITMVVTLLVLTIGVTFAYFMARTGEGKQAGTTITADTVDDLKFNVSKENLSLNINQFNFASGAGNLTDNVTATASLKANSTKKTAKYNYYVYFQIESNDYIYTTTDKKPEIVLSITGPNGEITSVDGLTYVSATNADGTVVKGFDITTLGKSITKIADAYEISSSSSTNYTNQEWNFKVTFINLDTNQSGNQNKNLTGKVLIQQEKIYLNLSDVAKSGDNLATAVQTLSSKGLSENTCLYYHDTNLANSAEDNSYRYSGENPNNYVCFGSDDETCPYENLYRIIGAFDGKIKLILADGSTSDMLGTDGGYYGNYYALLGDRPSVIAGYNGNYNLSQVAVYNWTTSGTNVWADSTINKINLNTNYISYLAGKNTKWKEMIDNSVWYVGGVSNNVGISTKAKTVYDYEVGPNKDSSSTVTTKIGLMYASDFYYGPAPKYWTVGGVNLAKSKDVNWMSVGLNEFPITRVSDNSYAVFNVSFDGRFSGWCNVSYSDPKAIRPVFYLKASVNFTGGIGTSTSPYRIS